MILSYFRSFFGYLHKHKDFAEESNSSATLNRKQSLKNKVFKEEITLSFAFKMIFTYFYPSKSQGEKEGSWFCVVIFVIVISSFEGKKIFLLRIKVIDLYTILYLSSYLSLFFTKF